MLGLLPEDLDVALPARFSTSIASQECVELTCTEAFEELALLLKDRRLSYP